MLRRLALTVLAGAGLSLGGAAAWGYWGAPVNPGAAGAALAAGVNAATTPTVNQLSATSVALSWPAVTLTNGVAVDGYVVKRYDAGTLVTQTVLGGCAGTVAATTCTETAVPNGTWRYAVYPRIGANWTGAESGLSTPVTVQAPVLTLARTLFNGPAGTTGTLTGFGVNETVAYRLDAATPLTGFPTVVDTSGYAPISALAIPATTQGTHTVWAIGGAGSVASTTITYDTVAPDVSASVAPAAGGTGWNTTSPVQVTLSATDATSGVAAVRYTVDGSDPTSSGTAVAYSGPFPLAASATVRFYATDVAGNSSAVGSRAVQIDTVAPGSSLALGSVSNARLSGSTVYYRGSAGGSFAVVNTVTDAGSGAASSTTSALGGNGAGWTHTASTVGAPSGGPYTSDVFTWTAGASGAPTTTVTAADVAGNTTDRALTFVDDSTGPGGVTVAVSGGEWSTSTTLSIGTSRGTDAGVGPALSGALLQRASASLSGGVCGAFGAFSVVQTDPASPVADAVADQACYRYRFVAGDLLGNTTTSAVADVKVDTTAPSTPTLSYSALTNAHAAGGTVWYRGSVTGSFTVTAAATDAAAGVATYAFPALGTGWTSTPGGSGVNTYAWTASPAAPGAKAVTATNNAGLTSAGQTFTPANDSTAPAGGSLTYNAGWTASNSVALTFSAGSDADSGLNSAAHMIQRRSAPLVLGVCNTAAWGTWTTIVTAPTSPRNDTTVTGDTCYQYQYVTYDNVGNSATYPANSNPIVRVPAYYTCQEAAVAGSAIGYYKLAEASGTTAADTSGNAKNGTYYNVSGYNAGGPCGGGGVTYNGLTMGHVATPLQVNNPTTYSEEIWFKTSSGNSMRLMGFGDAQTGSSASYDRVVYLDTTSKLVYGYNAGFLTYKTLTTTASYNDNKWHHVVATQSPGNGMRLYVDGALLKSDNTATTPQNFNGFWRIGSDNMSGWPALTILISSYTNGSLSHAAFYSRELGQQEVFNHYLAGQLSSPGVVNAPASFSASAASAASTARRLAATASAAPLLPSPSPSFSASGPPVRESSASGSPGPSVPGASPTGPPAVGSSPPAGSPAAEPAASGPATSGAPAASAAGSSMLESPGAPPPAVAPTGVPPMIARPEDPPSASD